MNFVYFNVMFSFGLRMELILFESVLCEIKNIKVKIIIKSKCCAKLAATIKKDQQRSLLTFLSSKTSPGRNLLTCLLKQPFDNFPLTILPTYFAEPWVPTICIVYNLFLVAWKIVILCIYVIFSVCRSYKVIFGVTFILCYCYHYA